jgi:cell division initiation protein
LLKPIEIENKDFKKALRGYREEEVDSFLDIVKEDYESIIQENLRLTEKLQMYIDQVNKYENIEDTLKATLITAQTTAEDTCSAANKKAKIIVEEADLKARQIIEQANNRIVEIRKEYDSLVREFKIFRNKFKSLLEDETKSIDDIFYDVDDNLGNVFEGTALYSRMDNNFNHSFDSEYSSLVKHEVVSSKDSEKEMSIEAIEASLRAKDDKGKLEDIEEPNLDSKKDDPNDEAAITCN